MSQAALVPLVDLAAGIAIDAWVYVDARRHAERGMAVTFRSGSLVVDTPAMWLLGCLVLWILFLPLYLTARSYGGR